MCSEFLFVYGTLRKSAGNVMHETLARHGEYFANGWMQGRLYEVRGYPGVIESSDAADRVVGEVYRIRNLDTVLPLLDDYEECTARFPEPHEYVRKQVLISLAAGGRVTAWAYIFTRDVEKLVRIESGDYLKV